MARINKHLYDIQFFRNKPGYKTYTWLISRANYRRDMSLSSHTIWVLTTDDAYVYDDIWKNEDITFEQFISFVKSRPYTKKYNDPFFY